MKCVECNKNFKPVRNDAKCCSKKCRTRRCRRKKEEAILDKKEQQLSLGEVKKQQKKKILDLDRQIHSFEQKITALKQEFSQLKEQEEITLIEMRTIREVMDESDKKIHDLIEGIPRGLPRGLAEKFEKRQVFHYTLKKCSFAE